MQRPSRVNEGEATPSPTWPRALGPQRPGPKKCALSDHREACARLAQLAQLLARGPFDYLLTIERVVESGRGAFADYYS